MRYSDDFIVVIPNTGALVEQTLQEISNHFNAVVGLTLEPSKTKYFIYEDQVLENCGARFGSPSEEKNPVINFLGFTFNGKKVSIRAKTVGKYYYRMYSKAKTIKRNGGYSPKGNRINAKNLYALYSRKGARGYQIKQKDGTLRWHSGNFLSYVQRAKRKFGKNELINRDTRRHMQKIHKILKHRKEEK